MLQRFVWSLALTNHTLPPAWVSGSRNTDGCCVSPADLTGVGAPGWADGAAGSTEPGVLASFIWSLHGHVLRLFTGVCSLVFIANLCHFGSVASPWLSCLKVPAKSRGSPSPAPTAALGVLCPLCSSQRLHWGLLLNFWEGEKPVSRRVKVGKIIVRYRGQRRAWETPTFLFQMRKSRNHAMGKGHKTGEQQVFTLNPSPSLSRLCSFYSCSMKFLEVTRGRMGLSACVPVRYARLLSSAQELATWPQVTMCLKGALTHADRCAHESPVPPHIRLDCSVSRPQQKRTRTAPRWGLPTSRTVRKYFCCLCHPSVVLHYGSPSNKPHLTNQEGGGPHFLTDRARVLTHQAAWSPLSGGSTNKSTCSPDGSSKRLPEMLKCSPIQLQSIVFWNQVS